VYGTISSQIVYMLCKYKDLYVIRIFNIIGNSFFVELEEKIFIIINKEMKKYIYFLFYAQNRNVRRIIRTATLYSHTGRYTDVLS